jgi:ferrochelatase
MAAVNLGRKPAPATDAPRAPGALVSAASEAAKMGLAHVEEPVAYDAILLASFGGPEGQDDVIPFLRNVTAGRGIPEERLEEVAHHYRAFGGISPINEQNRQLIAVATSAYSSYSSCRQYREDFADALEDTQLQGVIRIDKVRQFFDHPGFVTPFIEGTRDGIRDVIAHFEAEGKPVDLATDVEILFSTHSIPSSDAAKSGPAERGFDEDGAYAAQHLAVAEVVMHEVKQELGIDQDVPWQLVYQSRSGPPSMPWLEPDVNDAIGELPAQGRRAVVIVPLGFVSDHMEVKWDLDNEATESAAENGLYSVRVPTPGVHAAYVDGLIDLVLERRDGMKAADRPHMTDLGPWYDVCRTGCCENVRLGFKPAVSGLAP